MAITMKFFVTFFFIAFFIVSSLHCHSTTATPPSTSYGIKQQDVQCFYGTETCRRKGNQGCVIFCRDHGYFYGMCTWDACCCHVPYASRGPK
ncbi:hypothetical protein CARUB_v10015997mg [Capsella rubella]|uniref:Knottin scorpion toxin-like domain-containing protein n=1 Tax=Capsella rubella TaxID=81985 RepID=R0HSB6_9BRAS|nr:hypothetical protein CARUB_v10015997mg [Capsella rubella]